MYIVTMIRSGYKTIATSAQAVPVSVPAQTPRSPIKKRAQFTEPPRRHCWSRSTLFNLWGLRAATQNTAPYNCLLNVVRPSGISAIGPHRSNSVSPPRSLQNAESYSVVWNGDSLFQWILIRSGAIGNVIFNWMLNLRCMHSPAKD